ncbi:MAG: metallophosphoesterase [Lachnospiraceae bacterium]|nr:metallophosphoesterase [Lachnospiraceae bacterium]
MRIGAAFFVVWLCSVWSTAGLIAVHLLALTGILEISAFMVGRIGKSHRDAGWYQVLRRIYRSGLVPILVTCVMMGYGYCTMRQIVRTEYTVESDKLQSDYQVVLITDTHYGTVQSPDLLFEKIEEINALHPDFVILGGDIVEEGTSKEAMEEAFQVFGKLESTYGTYYVYGNHDRQRYRDAASKPREYTEDELEQAIEVNGITILRDRWTAIGTDVALAGREDVTSPSGRASSEELLKDIDRSRFIIVADHQPVGAEENAAAGVDLELSGHTHAGQIFPIGYFTELFGGMNYGEYQEGDCRVIVSSGTTGWGFPIRTQGKCEYVVVHLRRQQE